MSMRILTLLILLVMLSAMALSFYHMTHSMSLTGSAADCPFMAHETTICPMDSIDHLVAWKASFVTAVVVPIMVLSALNFGYVNLGEFFSLLRRRWRVLVVHRLWPTRRYSFPVRPLQELYAAGILNPKLF